MTNRSRAAITLTTTLMLGAYTYGHAFDIRPPGVLYDVWYGSIFGWIVFWLAVFGVFLVNRWWALVPAIAPTAVMIYLNMTGYASPWHEDLFSTPWHEDLSEHPLVAIGWTLFVFGWTIALAVFLSAGLLLRAIWERVRSRGPGGSLPGSA